MKSYLSTSYWQYKLNETTQVDYNAINCLRQKLTTLKKKLSTEYDPKERKILQKQIQIQQLRIEIAYIV